MTPEERAKDLYQFLFDHDAIDTGTLVDVEAVITKAIRDAEDAALEKAALLVAGLQGTTAVERVDLAGRVLSLKSKD